MGSQAPTPSGCTEPTDPSPDGHSRDTAAVVPPNSYRPKADRGGAHTAPPEIRGLHSIPEDGRTALARDRGRKELHRDGGITNRAPETNTSNDSPTRRQGTTTASIGARGIGTGASAGVVAGTERVPLALLAAIRADGVYRPLRVLGVGSYGMVLLVIDERDATLRALKCTRNRRMWRAEVEASEALGSHPGFAEFVEAKTLHAGFACIAQEYIDGPDLYDKWSSQISPSALVESRRHFRDILEALAYCHSSGWVHGDVKPENVVIGSDGRARLVDLGTCRYVGTSLLPSPSLSPSKIGPGTISSGVGEGAGPGREGGSTREPVRQGNGGRGVSPLHREQADDISVPPRSRGAPTGDRSQAESGDGDEGDDPDPRGYPGNPAPAARGERVGYGPATSDDNIDGGAGCAIVGSREYISPEALACALFGIRPPPSLSAASDLYAVGVMLYMLAAGKWPRRKSLAKGYARAARSAEWSHGEPRSESDAIPPIGRTDFWTSPEVCRVAFEKGGQTFRPRRGPNGGKGAWPAPTSEEIDLVGRLLHPLPHLRVTAREALGHPWFGGEIREGRSATDPACDG